MAHLNDYTKVAMWTGPKEKAPGLAWRCSTAWGWGSRQSYGMQSTCPA
jgi:hypothetical protein